MSYDHVPDQAPEVENRFALRLRMLRSARGLAPETLAQAAGMEVAKYLGYEDGSYAITAALLMRLSRVLGVGPAVFFDPS